MRLRSVALSRSSKDRVVQEAIQKMQPGGREGPRHQGTPLPAPVEVRQEGKVGDGQGWLLREGGRITWSEEYKKEQNLGPLGACP